MQIIVLKITEKITENTGKAGEKAGKVRIEKCTVVFLLFIEIFLSKYYIGVSTIKVPFVSYQYYIYKHCIHLKKKKGRKDV